MEISVVMYSRTSTVNGGKLEHFLIKFCHKIAISTILCQLEKLLYFSSMLEILLLISVIFLTPIGDSYCRIRF